jgi:hypothetical protein
LYIDLHTMLPTLILAVCDSFDAFMLLD